MGAPKGIIPWNKGKKNIYSEETRKRLSQSHMGQISGMKDKNHSEETKEKIKQARIGKIASKETKERMRQAHLGKTTFKGKRHSEETKERMRQAHIGQVSWNKGKHHSEEAREKIRRAHIGDKNFNYGKHFSEEIKKKMSQTRIGKNKGNKNPSWKGGITPIFRLLRTSTKYVEWRQKCFIRDSFICQKCGMNSGDLNVHHKKLFATLIKEAQEYLPLFTPYDAAMLYEPLWDVDNGKTLCEKCHRKSKHKAAA